MRKNPSWLLLIYRYYFIYSFACFILFAIFLILEHRYLGPSISSYWPLLIAQPKNSHPAKPMQGMKKISSTLPLNVTSLLYLTGCLSVLRGMNEITWKKARSLKKPKGFNRLAWQQPSSICIEFTKKGTA